MYRSSGRASLEIFEKLCCVERYFLHPEHISVVFAQNKENKTDL